MNSVNSDPRAIQIVFVVVGIILVVGVYLIQRKKEKKTRKAKGLLPLSKADTEAPLLPVEAQSSDKTKHGAAEVSPVRMPVFRVLQRRPSVIADLFHVLLILLSLVVAAGFILILLPEGTVDKMAGGIQARRGAAQPERISLLYLGDELINNNEFHVRGVVRNITAVPIERLDAAIRFFSHDGTVLETTIVRFDKERIEPDQIAQFDLVYRDYRSQFASYSVEFKLREGASVPYKDLRQNVRR